MPRPSPKLPAIGRRHTPQSSPLSMIPNSPSSTRRLSIFAVSLATKAALRIAKPDDAHRFAVRASQMPEGDIDDWRSRLTAAMKIGAVVDEAECLKEIARRTGAPAEFLSENTIFQVFRKYERPGG